jgi:hypothetical protein
MIVHIGGILKNQTPKLIEVESRMVIIRAGGWEWMGKWRH